MQVKWISNIDEFITIRGEWDRALELSGADNPFLLSEFIIIWWESFGEKNRLEIFLMQENDKIIAGFPLYVKKLSMKIGFLYCLRQIGESFANINAPFFYIDKKTFTKYFFEAINKLNSWDYCHFFNVRNNFFELASVKSSLSDIGFNIIYTSNETNPIIEIQSNIDSYIKSRGKKLRENIRYYRNKLEKYGAIELKEINEINEIEDLCSLLIQYSKESREYRKKLSSYNNKNYENFTQKIIMHFAANDKIYALLLKNSKDPIAIVFGYKYGTGFKWIYTSYNPIYSKVSPGYTLIYELIKFTCDRELGYIDLFSGGNVFYKKQWANRIIALSDIKIFNHNFTGRIFHKLYKIRLLIMKIASNNEKY